jgi:hypothetical protein
MFEYLGLLGLGTEAIFDLDSLEGISLAGLTALLLIIIGYLIKGFWGAVIALGVGVLVFLYVNDLLVF